MVRTTSVTGEAGTFLVAAELALQGWPAALTSAGTRRTDLLAQVGEQQLPAAIQVKTKSERVKDFQPGSVRDASRAEANEWVVLVALSRRREHRFFVVPRNVVVATVGAANIAFGKPTRVLLGEQEYAGYLNDWSLMQQPAWRAPWKVKRWVYKRMAEMTWPSGSGPPPEVEIIDD